MFKQLIARNVAVVLTLVGTTLGVAPLTVAQSIDQVDKTPYQSNERNPNGELGDFMNPLGLMHRANLERSRGGGEFAEDTHNNLNEAAKNFREAQMRAIEAQQSPQNSAGVPTEVNLEE